MKDIFDLAIRLLLRHEGGFVNNPKDPGGMTNLGVTKRSWEAHKGHSVTEADMRALTPAAVQTFYKRRYWDAINGDDLPKGVDFCLFDTCVNSGPKRAVLLLQAVLGVTQDGVLGPATLKAVSLWPAKDLITQYSAARLSFMRSLPTWDTFGKGWKKRVYEVEDEAITFAKAG